MLVYPMCSALYLNILPTFNTVTCFLSFVNFRIIGPICPAQHLSRRGRELGHFSHVLDIDEWFSQVCVFTLSLNISILSWFLKKLVS